MGDKGLFLPDLTASKKEYEFKEGNSLVIIGANGSGKSRMGAWIEMNNSVPVHRVSAQRSLTVPELINLKSYDQAFAELYWGDPKNKQTNKGQRWSYGKFTTSLLNDYDKVLSTLFAKQNKLNNEFAKDCKEREGRGESYAKVPESEIDKIIKMWEAVFPHRELVLEDASVFAEFGGQRYPGSEMSDGERVVLYLMGQCMCAPENSIVVIDEPEIHVHKSLMSDLWNQIEQYRRDCLFVYITHDVQFATSRINSVKLWVHKFMGNDKWEWEFIENSEELPEDLLMEILGARKRILFVEGTRDSLDFSLYEQLYPSYYVIPRGSCIKVIESTKSMRGNSQLHHLDTTGLIDRDFRTSEEIESLARDNIYVLDIAEVENLFCVEEILQAVSEHLMLGIDTVDSAKNFVMDSFDRDIERQINFAVINEIKYRLSIYNVKDNGFEGIMAKVQGIPDEINVREIYDLVRERYYVARNSRDYGEILKLYNQKGVSKSIGSCFNYNNKDYCNLVIRLLNSEKRQQILDGFRGYVPSFN